MQQISDHLTAGSKAVKDLNFGGPTTEFRAAAVMIDGMRDVPTETQAGQTFKTAMDFCFTAYNDTADAVEAIDVDGMSAAADEVKTCTSLVNDATTAIDDL